MLGNSRNKENQDIILSNQTLVIRQIERHTAGNYTCVAANRLGESSSAPLHLHVKCKFFSSIFFSFISSSAALLCRRNAIKFQTADLLFVILDGRHRCARLPPLEAVDGGGVARPAGDAALPSGVGPGRGQFPVDAVERAGDEAAAARNVLRFGPHEHPQVHTANRLGLWRAAVLGVERHREAEGAVPIQNRQRR